MLPTAHAAAQDTSTSGGPLVICEATGNPGAPYVEVDVPRSDLSTYSAAEGDIIPAPAAGCPAKAAGTTVPGNAHRRSHPKVAEAAPAPPSTAAPALTATPPPATNMTTAATVDPAPSPSQRPGVAPLRALPNTGGHTQITIVLGLLLLYSGGVVRWALARPRSGAAHRGGAVRRRG
jgi:hypothetical protein